MAFEKKTWKDRSVEYPNRRKLTAQESGESSYYTLERAEGIIEEEGDAFSAENMNGLEGRIADAIDDVQVTDAVTQATNDASTKIANTQFVHNALDAKITYGETDLEDGVSALATGTIYIYVPENA